MNSYGNEPSRDLTALSSSDLDSIIEWDPNNQTVMAGAGVSLGRLQELLGDHNQWLPIRPPRALLKHTLGGLVASGACGPERLSYGAPRDLLLGLRFIDGRGRLISTGGRVAKNVAGYDLTRLIAGSAGTMGYITDVTFRIESRPEQCAVITGSGSMEACSQAASELLKSHLSPQWVVSMPDDQTHERKRKGRWVLMIGHEGFQETVDYLISATGSLLDRNKLTVQGIDNYSLLEGYFKNIYEKLNRFPFLLRADIPLDRLRTFILALNSDLRSDNALLDLGLGRLVMGFELMGDKSWNRLCKRAANMGGHIILEKAPPPFKKTHEVFGVPHPSWKIMRKIKEALDPDNMFSPGCLPGRR